jgi:2-polyprenyl-6-methoxyphenol hydroxylase-like FAD-dependent oxidoreductase
MEVVHELGILDTFLARPHSELREARGVVGDERVILADFSHLPVHAPFIAMVPQWDFFDFLAGEGRRYPTFMLLMQAEVFALIERDHRIAGVRAQTPGGPIDIHAHLVVGADGRSSTVRSLARMRVEDLGAPIDVLWMRLPKLPEDSAEAALGNIRNGHVFVILDRGDYWQCAFVIAKGGYEDLRRSSVDDFRAQLVSIVPWLGSRVNEIRSWDDVKLLTVKVDRLSQWHRPGLLCIGDAAHAMSPVGGVGINLAIQDAVATANILWRPLQHGTPSAADLQAVQRRRELPTRITQAVQVFVQRRVLFKTITGGGGTGGGGPDNVPAIVRLLIRFPLLRRLPARFVGLGVRPEHVRTPEQFTKTQSTARPSQPSPKAE